MIFNSGSIADTQFLAQKLVEKTKVGSVVALIGNLGTGKTTFTQGFARAIGVNERVGSPTFKLVSEYKGKDHWLYHIDAYRLEGVNDFLKIGGEEYLRPEKGVTLIEWANIIGEIFDDTIISIQFSRIKGNPNSRKIEVMGIDIDV
ncbi:MAG: tRNA (adenosine(37)-N6)-threonylcarbamoyltransferase complex ATPase subunit type 1 TsaE [Candidatus Marinimicrobia bacterium]|nr:tRNA (adenosine(37)-N6)-threonylcarbamoyltransferase complex ATPase subunit type 1 TsaE [Candidatus Neomarinimicrobiota bacterium]|tara:strand:- start:53 stop:490 length:438 start_codon:yes stop_codon:yes gene_type:complete